MFQAPIRLLLSLRPSTAPGVLLANAVSTLVFMATPFLIRGIALERDLEVGLVGVISTAQLGGFTAAAWGAGRLIRPSRDALVLALVIGVVANAASAVAPSFWILVVTRLLSGISLGLVAWIAWAEAFGDDEKVGDTAIIAPVVGTVGLLPIAIAIDRAGPDALFWAFAGLHLVPLAFTRSLRLATRANPRTTRHRPTRAALAILACLGLLTTGGSAVFVYLAVIGQDEVGLSAVAVSLAFAANGLAGIPSARFRKRRRRPGAWLCLIAVLAAVATLTLHPVSYWIAVPLWGFAFWMAVPGAFTLLAERSRHPEERAGDAQAVLAAGRMVGPAIGGAVYSASIPILGVVSGAIIATAGIGLLVVESASRPLAPAPS